MNKLLALMCLGSGVTGCGYTDGGGGSRTLEVQARLEYRAHDNQTDIRIDVRKDGAVLDDANITITDGDTDKRFEIEQNNPGGEYRDDIDGYHRRVELRIESNSDELNAQLEGPGIHFVTAPANDTVVKRDDIGDSLEVEWETKDGMAAEEVDVRIHSTGYTKHITNWEDPGSADIPSGKIDEGDEETRVVRRNKVRLDGGTGSSSLEITYEARNSFLVQ